MPDSRQTPTSDLEFRMLGELEVRRAGVALPLPPSKKTRALLGYLVLTGRAHRREALCDLLWDVTDDPRGALRWSLSKLRKLVDDDGHKRLESDRDRVELHARGARIDLRQMRAELSGEALSKAPTELVEHYCEQANGEVLEGLDLPDFDVYQAWLVAEREQARRVRAEALCTLVTRLEDDPARALHFARSWGRVDPMSLEARLAALRMGLRSGQLDDAKRYFEASRRTFAELDPKKEGALRAGWHALRTQGASPSTPPIPEPEEAPATERSSLLDTGRISFPDLGMVVPRASAQLPLTGRDDEKQLLTRTLREVAKARRGRLVLVVGEPGIGKSRLLSELVQVTEEAKLPVLLGAAYEGEAGRPYGPWIDALRKLSAGALSDELRARLAPLLEAGASTDLGTREALFGGVSDVLHGLTEAPDNKALLVVLEDAHWLDEGSAELLHYVVRMQRNHPVLFVLSARRAELSDSSSLLRVLRSLRRDVEQHDMPLDALPEDATAALVARVNPDLDAHAVHQRSGGNPLYALELARSHAELSPDGSLPDAIRERLDRLTPEAEDLLRWCAVLGASVDPSQLASLSSLGAEEQLFAFEELERHALMRAEGDAYAFAHDVVRQVVYAGLSQPRRVLMHRRAAEALRSLQAEDRMVEEASVADIARHAAAAGDHALAAEAHVAAGKRCLRLLATQNASVLVRRGLHHARKLAEPDRARFMLELYDILLSAERPRDEEAFCEEVQALSETALAHGCVHHARLGFNMQSYLHWERGDWYGARENMARAEEAARGGEGEVRALALAQAARCEALLERDMGLAEAYLKEAIASTAQAERAPVLLDAEALLRRFEGDLAVAGKLFQQAGTRARAGRDRFVELQVSMSRCELLYDSGDHEAALELAKETLVLAEKARDGSERPYATLLVALNRFALGEDAAEPNLREALAELEEVDAKHRATFGLNRSAELLLLRGRPGDAEPLARQALAASELLEWPSEELVSLVLLHRALLALEQAAEAAEMHTRLSTIESHRVNAHARSVVAKWLSQE